MRRNAIEVKNVSYKYPNARQFTLKNLSLTVKSGEWLTLIGPNGSGKSTLVKLIDGLLSLTSGQIFVDGTCLKSKNVAAIRSKIGVIFQNPIDQFVFPNVEDDLAFGLENHNVPRSRMIKKVDSSLNAVGMLKFKSALISDLSGGQKQRIALAEVIALDPRIMILDESVSMLNPVARQRILKLINQLRRDLHLTVITITHGFDEVKYSDRLALIVNGHVIANGSPRLILRNRQLLEFVQLPLPKVGRLINLLKRYGIMVPGTVNNETEVLNWLKQFR